MAHRAIVRPLTPTTRFQWRYFLSPEPRFQAVGISAETAGAIRPELGLHLVRELVCPSEIVRIDICIPPTLDVLHTLFWRGLKHILAALLEDLFALCFSLRESRVVFEKTVAVETT